MDEQKDTSPHILNTSSTLLGLCFIVLTTFKVNNRIERTIIDDLTALAIIIFLASSILSFIAIRSNKNGKYEKIADVVFLSGLFLLFVITMLIIFNVIE